MILVLRMIMIIIYDAGEIPVWASRLVKKKKYPWLIKPTCKCDHWSVKPKQRVPIEKFVITCWHCFSTSSKIFFSQSRTIRLDSDMKISFSTSLYPLSLCASCFTTIRKFWGEMYEQVWPRFLCKHFYFTSIGPMVDVFPKISFNVIIESLSWKDS